MEYIKSIWEKIKDFFKRSLTIAWARIQVLAGMLVAAIQGVDWASVYTAITHLDWSQLKTSTISAAVMILNGIITEVLRRRSLNA